MRGCSGWAATTEAAKATAEAKASDFAYMIARRSGQSTIASIKCAGTSSIYVEQKC